MSEAIATIGATKERKRRGLLADLAIRLFREKPMGTAGAIIVLLLLFVGIFANFIAPYGMNETIVDDRLAPPSATHILGTDNMGRDMLSRIIYGARISLIVGLSATAIAEIVAITLGTVSGFFGGKVDLIMQRFIDAWMSFPSLVILITILSLTGPGIIQVIVLLGLLSGIGGSRVVRSAVIGVRENVYIQAAKAIGVPTGRTLIRHILPNILPVIFVTFSIGVGAAILAESSLSFLGFGIPPPAPSWGGMLSGSGRDYMEQAPWMVLWPGLALALVVYGINMLGDALRDLVDPRLRGGLGRYSVAMAKRRRVLRENKRGEGEETMRRQ